MHLPAQTGSFHLHKCRMYVVVLIGNEVLLNISFCGHLFIRESHNNYKFLQRR